MDFAEAAAFIMPYGQHKGKTLDAIATDDAGLRYLDWLVGARQGSTTRLDVALAVYLRDPAIARELAALR